MRTSACRKTATPGTIVRLSVSGYSIAIDRGDVVCSDLVGGFFKVQYEDFGCRRLPLVWGISASITRFRLSPYRSCNAETCFSFLVL